MAKAKKGLDFETVGWEEHAQQMLVLSNNLEKKYAIAFTAAVAKSLNRAEKANIKRGDAASRRYAKWPKPLFKMIKTKRLGKKAKTKHGAIGHRVGLFGKGGWASRGAWLERGHVTADGGRTRAYEWVKPSRDQVEPTIPAKGKAGIVNKLKRDAKRAAKKIAASKKP